MASTGPHAKHLHLAPERLHASTSPLSFYRQRALLLTKQQRQSTKSTCSNGIKSQNQTLQTSTIQKQLKNASYLSSSLFSNIQDKIFIQVTLLALGWTDTVRFISLHNYRLNIQVNASKSREI